MIIRVEYSVDLDRATIDRLAARARELGFWTSMSGNPASRFLTKRLLMYHGYNQIIDVKIDREEERA